MISSIRGARRSLALAQGADGRVSNSVVPPTAPPAPAERFGLLIEGLCRAIAARSAVSRLAAPLLLLLWPRLRRMAARFARLAARFRAGRLPARPAARRPGRSGPPPQPLPKTSAWLVRLVPAAAAQAAQLQHLLADPELAALLAAAPQAGRVLRPLCRMLGVAPPGPPAPPRPPRAAPAAPAQASPAASPPLRRPGRGRSGAGWVPRTRLFVWRPPPPA